MGPATGDEYGRQVTVIGNIVIGSIVTGRSFDGYRVAKGTVLSL